MSKINFWVFGFIETKKLNIDSFTNENWNKFKGIVWRFCTFYKDISGTFLLQNKIQSFQFFNMLLLTSLTIQKKFLSVFYNI